MSDERLRLSDRFKSLTEVEEYVEELERYAMPSIPEMIRRQRITLAADRLARDRQLLIKLFDAITWDPDFDRYKIKHGVLQEVEDHLAAIEVAAPQRRSEHGAQADPGERDSPEPAAAARKADQS